jgi:hypothetical protein
MPMGYGGGAPQPTITPLMSTMATLADQGQETPTIRPIIHPGHAPREDEELVAVIVTVCSGSSYDDLFGRIPQLAGDGKRVATYAVSGSSLPHIAGE